MDKQEFYKLAQKISEGKASEREISLYNYYYNQLQKINSSKNEESHDTEELRNEIWSRIEGDIDSETNDDVPVRSITFQRYRVAAAVVLLIMSAALFFVMKPDDKTSVTAKKADVRYKNDIAPGKNKAVLTLADGSSLVLDESQKGTLAEQGASKIKKTADGSLIYSPGGQSSDESKREVFNVISIPKGGQYNLTLSDGTRVWLNASSSLKFPACFNEKERVVELEGEAYFEVAKKLAKGSSGRIPFLVKTASQTVEVLGTHFNVKAYQDDIETKTTLLEGSVRVKPVLSTVKNQQTVKSQLLVPGQQSVLLTSSHSVSVSEVDTEEAIAWKNGMFYFNNTDLKAIMTQLSRWYDINVDIQEMPSKQFNGILSRNVKLSKVLDMMEKTSGLKFKIEGRRVSMMP
ncbi:FecR family protein [Desertivirga xinjiangensis]|uniref:FecR family protein n=1 Tax=Desertivirga xinjiangensis TaxID=539206 RepID=UPI00210A3E6F|nr:FecR family protein [Pedobacter xinjiangensis]